MYFSYGEKEVDYLKSKDKKLAAVIDRIGPIDRKVDDDLFSSVVRHIIGQQISTAAQATRWNRLSDKVGSVKRYSPYGTVASLYLWAIAGGAIPELTDPAPARKKL